MDEAQRAQQLAALEKLLQSSLGYDLPAADEDRHRDEAEQPPKKKRKKGKGVPEKGVEPVAAPLAEQEEEVVGASIELGKRVGHELTFP